MRFTAFQAAFALLVLTLNACGYSTQPGDPNGPGAVVSVVGVKVTPQSVILVAIGETRQLVATVAPANATDKVLAWESTDPRVVTVDAAGLVTAKAAGSGVFITAITHDGHFQSSVNVSVTP